MFGRLRETEIQNVNEEDFTCAGYHTISISRSELQNRWVCFIETWYTDRDMEHMMMARLWFAQVHICHTLLGLWYYDMRLFQALRVKMYDRSMNVKFDFVLCPTRSACFVTSPYCWKETRNFSSLFFQKINYATDCVCLLNCNIADNLVQDQATP